MPAAPCYLRPFALPANSDLSLARPLVLDLYEMTRGDLEYYYGRFRPEATRPHEAYEWTTNGPLVRIGKNDWPACMTFPQAQELAALRGMRLPTAREWLHVAVGRRGLDYPWGKDQSSVANTRELGLGAPAPVGTFENGRSRPFGCYDMVGNVWEWVTDTVPGVLDASMDFNRSSGQLRDDPDQVSVLGGAYDSARQPTFFWHRLRDADRYMLVFHGRRAEPETLSPAIGARMCADAERYLWEKAGEWGSGGGGGESTRARVTAVGRRWARDPTARDGLLALLKELRTRPGAPAALAWLAEGARARAAPGAAE